MLLYLGKGVRKYGEKPLEIQRRRGWEFQAVLSGKIAPLLPQGEAPLETSHLWIFPPNHPHGWAGIAGKRAEVAVFHFMSVPEILHRMLGKEGHLEVMLTRRNVNRLRDLRDGVEKYWSHPAPGMMICFEHALMELSLMVCEVHAARINDFSKSLAQDRVEKAIQWFSQRLEKNPGLEEMAGAVSVSPAHLRRLFHEVLETSPKQIMDQQRFQRAMLLMSDSKMKFEEISEKCGFHSASAFSRAFKIKFGCSPEEWRGKRSVRT